MTDERRAQLDQELTKYQRLLSRVDLSTLTAEQINELKKVMLCAETTALAAIREADKVIAPPR